jgi:hypothetical protein
MAGSGGEAPDHGGLRASDADRDHAIDNLKTAFVHGRLNGDELDLRVGQALAARTQADLAVLTADIPDEMPGTPRPPAPVRPRRDPPVKTAAALIAAATDAGALAAAISGAVPAVIVFILLLLGIGMTGTGLIAALIRGLERIEARSSGHPGGQLPPPADPTGSRSRTPRLPSPGPVRPWTGGGQAVAAT